MMSDEEESPAMSSYVIVSYNDKKYYINGNEDSHIEELKKDVVMNILGHAPSLTECAHYSLFYNGLALEESKTIQEYSIIEKEIDCKIVSNYHIRVYNVFDELEKDISFGSPISIANVLHCVSADCADEYFLTRKGSSIVLRNNIYKSTDVTRIYMFVYYCSTSTLRRCNNRSIHYR